MGQALSVSRPAGKLACPQTRYRKRSALPAKDIREVTDAADQEHAYPPSGCPGSRDIPHTTL